MGVMSGGCCGEDEEEEKKKARKKIVEYEGGLSETAPSLILM